MLDRVNATASAVPDSRGINLYTADPALRDLAGLYAPADLLAHLEPHLHRLGGLAGGKLDDLAGQADRNPPILHARSRSGADVQHIEKHPAYTAMEQMAFGDYGLAALSCWAGRAPCRRSQNICSRTCSCRRSSG
jgi:hypothetical protein